MKKKLSKLLTLALALTMAFSLAACGGKQDVAPTQPNQGSSTAIVETERPSETEQQSTTLSKYLSNGETIWYRTNATMGNIGKDSTVGEVLVFNPDGTMYYANEQEITLGELSQMEGADIVSMVKQAHSERALGSLANFADMGIASQKDDLFTALFHELPLFIYDFPDGIPEDVLASYMGDVKAQLVKPYVDELLTGLVALNSQNEYFITNINFEYFTYAPKEDAQALFEPEIVPQMENLYDVCTAAAKAVCDYIENYEAEAGQYKLSINTDKTGNTAESMTLAFQVPVNGKYEINSFTLNAASGEGEVVYDTQYGGFSLFRGSSLLTRVDGSYNFVVNQIGEDNLPLDKMPEELFQ